MSLKKQGKYQFDDFEVDLAERSIRRNGHSIAVSSRTFDVLAFLLLNPQRSIAADELVSELWPRLQVEEINLAQHIFLLRKALTGDTLGEIILTLPGKSYKFNSEVTRIKTPIEDPPRNRTPNRQLPSASFGVQEDSSAKFDPEAAVPRKSFQNRFLNLDGHSGIDEPSSQPELPDEKASRRLPALHHRAPWQFALATILLTILALGAWFTWHWTHRQTRDSLGIVTASFQNSTSDPQFDLALQTALTLDLQQSPYLRIASPRRLIQTLVELKLPYDSEITASSAQQACRQLNDQAYLQGKIARFALKYLVTVEVFDCASGHRIASSKGLANSPENVLLMVDKIALDLRQQLHEPSASITRFNKPLFATKAGSLNALKAYAQATSLVAQGKFTDAIALYELALRLSPKMTMAYADIAAAYANLRENDRAADNITKAYESRDTVNEPLRLFIVATYNQLVSGDLQASIRNQQQWAQEYPNNPAPFGNLADLELQIGKPAMATDPARRALALNPQDALSYVILARAQLHLGQTDEAADTCHLAIARHVDDAQIHLILMQIAYLRLDQPALDEQLAWSKGRPEEPAFQSQQSQIDFAQGKVKAALAMLNKIAAADRDKDNPDLANQVLESVPRTEAELGYLQSALSALTRQPDVQDSTDIPVAWAEVGETSRSEQMLHQQLQAHPFSTLLQLYQAPQIRAAVSLAEHQPDAAIDDLAVALPLDLRAFNAVAIRARAYLANKQPVLAEAEFHKILDHSGVEPLSYNYPLAQLGVARALAAQGKIVEAGFAYKIVLAIWKDADPDLPRLKEAKAEYAKLKTLPSNTPAFE